MSTSTVLVCAVVGQCSAVALTDLEGDGKACVGKNTNYRDEALTVDCFLLL